MNRDKNRHGFTFIEVLVILSILITILGTAIQALIQFRRSVDSGERSIEAAHEAMMFVEQLRNDLRNAVPPVDSKSATLRGTIRCTRDELSFPIFRDSGGTPDSVTYRVLGRSIIRVAGTSDPQTLVSGSLSSFSWNLCEDGVNRSSSFQAGRVWVQIDGSFGKPGRAGETRNPFRVRTNLFPVRWNRMVAGSPGH